MKKKKTSLYYEKQDWFLNAVQLLSLFIPMIIHYRVMEQLTSLQMLQ